MIDMKKSPLIAAFLLFSNVLISQNTGYYSSVSSESYSELINPTPINDGVVWNESSSFLIDLGFEFSIYNQTYSSLTVMAGGIVFPGSDYRAIRVFHTPFGGYLLKDKGTTSSISAIDYEVLGVEGHHVVKVQWKNAGFNQWYSTSSGSDYANFQIWLFQDDGHLELHFGPSQTNPGTYGYPEATSDPDPGPSIVFFHTACDSVFCYFDEADNPTYDYFNWCSPNQSFVDGTPSEGTIYTIARNQTITGILDFNHDHLSIFPNPSTNQIFIRQLTTQSGQFVVRNILGKEVISGSLVSEKQSVDLSELKRGIYFVTVLFNNATWTKEILKY